MAGRIWPVGHGLLTPILIFSPFLGFRPWRRRGEAHPPSIPGLQSFTSGYRGLGRRGSINLAPVLALPRQQIDLERITSRL